MPMIDSQDVSQQNKHGISTDHTYCGDLLVSVKGVSYGSTHKAMYKLRIKQTKLLVSKINGRAKFTQIR